MTMAITTYASRNRAVVREEIAVGTDLIEVYARTVLRMLKSGNFPEVRITGQGKLMSKAMDVNEFLKGRLPDGYTSEYNINYTDIPKGQKCRLPLTMTITFYKSEERLKKLINV